MTATATAYESWDEDGLVCIRNSRGAICGGTDPARLLEFLRYSAADTIRATWDLDAFIAPVLRLLPKPVLQSLSEYADDTHYNDHQLYYLPNRMLRIGRSRFFGLQGFWPTSEPVPSTLEDVQQKADELLDTLAHCGMPSPKGLTSPIAVFEMSELGRQVYASIPKGYEIPPQCFEALQYAAHCDRREWITAYQLGHWREGEIWDYDINSTYPSCAAELLDLRSFDFWKSDRYSGREDGAYYGFLRGHLVLDPDSSYIHCSPVMADLERMPGNPAGDFGEDYYLTLDELRFIRNLDMGAFWMKDGWFMSPLGGTRPGKPFRDVMNWLYEKRSWSDLAASVMKNTANQLVGKLIETKVTQDYGELRNDIYHALVLAQSRVKVASFLVENQVSPEELVAVQTDGCRIARYTPTTGNGMGSWRCNGSAPTIVASPYKVYTQDKKPGHLTYDHLVEMIQAHPDDQYYGRSVKHRTTLRQAVQQGDITRVGEEVDLSAHLDLNTLPREQNRVYPRMPGTGRELLGGKFGSAAMVL